MAEAGGLNSRAHVEWREPHSRQKPARSAGDGRHTHIMNAAQPGGAIRCLCRCRLNGTGRVRRRSGRERKAIHGQVRRSPTTGRREGSRIGPAEQVHNRLRAD